MSTVFQRDINWSAVQKTSPITPDIQAHLVNVYTVLSATILAGALGSLAFLRFQIGGTLSFIAGILMMFWLAATPKQNQ